MMTIAPTTCTACEHPLPGGGYCTPCEILFGPYEALLANPDVAEWEVTSDDHHNEPVQHANVA